MEQPDDEKLQAILDGLRQEPVRITADLCSGSSVAIEAFCELIRLAPSVFTEVLRLRAAVKTQALAMHSLNSVRAAQSAHDQRVLASLEAKDRAALLEEIAALKAERDAFNAEATDLRMQLKGRNK